MMKLLPYIRIALLLGCSTWSGQTLLASCSITSGGVATITFTIPSLIINSDAEPGTILYTEDNPLNSGAVKVTCNANGNIYQGYTVLSDSDLVANSPLEKVYATNIPGIGFRAGWGNNASIPLSSGSLISPWHQGSSTVNKKDGPYTITLTAAAQLVVTGPVKSGVLDTSKLVADWKYDNTVIARLRFASTDINVQANTCELVDKNITVPLTPVMSSDFENNVSAIVSDSSFKIQLQNCVSNIKVDYKFTTSGSTGVSNGNILSIAIGSGAAEGVGIQILDSQNTVLQFDQEYTVTTKTTEKQSLSVPLKARYIKTGAIKGGDVNAVATFEVYYR